MRMKICHIDIVDVYTKCWWRVRERWREMMEVRIHPHCANHRRAVPRMYNTHSKIGNFHERRKINQIVSSAEIKVWQSRWVENLRSMKMFSSLDNIVALLLFGCCLRPTAEDILWNSNFDSLWTTVHTYYWQHYVWRKRMCSSELSFAQKKL